MFPLMGSPSHSHSRSSISLIQQATAEELPSYPSLKKQTPPIYDAHTQDKVLLTGDKPSQARQDFEQWLAQEWDQFQSKQSSNQSEDPEEAFSRFLEQRHPLPPFTTARPINPFAQSTPPRGTRHATTAESITGTGSQNRSHDSRTFFLHPTFSPASSTERDRSPILARRIDGHFYGAAFSPEFSRFRNW